jgi:hypothetical protein
VLATQYSCPARRPCFACCAHLDKGTSQCRFRSSRSSRVPTMSEVLLSSSQLQHVDHSPQVPSQSTGPPRQPMQHQHMGFWALAKRCRTLWFPYTGFAAEGGAALSCPHSTGIICRAPKLQRGYPFVACPCVLCDSTTAAWPCPGVCLSHATGHAVPYLTHDHRSRLVLGCCACVCLRRVCHGLCGVV